MDASSPYPPDKSEETRQAPARAAPPADPPESALPEGVRAARRRVEVGGWRTLASGPRPGTLSCPENHGHIHNREPPARELVDGRYPAGGTTLERLESMHGLAR